MVKELKGGFLFLVITLITTTVIFLYNCQEISTFEESSVTRYQMFTSNYEENSTVIRYVSRCGPFLSNIVDQIIQLYKPKKQLLCIITDKVMEDNCLADTFESLLRSGNKNILTMIPGARSFDSRRIIYQKPTVYLLLSSVNLSAVLQPLISFGNMGATWNPRGLYIGISESKEEAVNVMKSLLESFVYKVIVLVVNENNNFVEAYTWRPYYPKNYCGPPTMENIIRLGIFRDSLKFEKETDIKPGMLPTTFENCYINVSFTVWEPYVISLPDNRKIGIEVTLLKLICEKTGLRINPVRYADKSQRKYTQILIGSVLPIRSTAERFDVSVPYIQDTLCWLVPCYVEQDIFELVHKLSISIWGPSFLAMSLAAISLLASGCKNWILLVWASFWEQPNEKIPKKIQSIWGFWLFLCLHLSVVYKTALVSELTADPTIKGEGESQAGLLETNLKLGFIPAAEYYFDKEDKVEKAILDRYVPCDTVPKCYDEIPTGRAVFTNVMLARYLNAKQDNSTSHQVCQLPTSLTYKVVLLFAKGHAAARIFDKFLHYSLEGGFVKYYIEQIEVAERKITMRRLDSTINKKLTFEQVYDGFYVLAVGLCVSGISFVWELFGYLLIEKCSIYTKLKRIIFRKVNIKI